ncbi:M1 family metallopeptidase [Chengkuizengella axinellae]|uniref:M1 family metallopeptidase n=1 Tax=Chengkuizengella axinellae TaxID=3064388 RepID=A0ABT9IU96_9BACL|nr:M1 family metallopeptidase [Chengkuizengella sp. 2205SS18-9]MDP5272872.1 M1 family metallopeptidase [Chengkuizengella sp. 2205SS18-9]
MGSQLKRYSSPLKFIVLILIFIIFGGTIFFITNDDVGVLNNQTNEDRIAQNKNNETKQDEIKQNDSNNTNDSESTHSLSGEEQNIINDSNPLVSFNEFVPNPVPVGSKGTYNLTFEMNDDGRFFVEADIEVENLSEDDWSEIVFYFIPNVFTTGNEKYEELLQIYRYSIDASADAKINHIHINEQSTDYELEYDTLRVLLSEPLLPNDKRLVSVSYEFSVPMNGMRFKQDQGNYHLAQWYPMLANYNSGWNKNDYFPIPESYHTNFSDFHVSFDIPEGFTIFSSSESDPSSGSTAGEFSALNVKEMFVSVLQNDMVFQSDYIEDIEIRISAFSEQSQDVDEALATAKDAISYFHNEVGNYPHKQFDIVLGENLPSMEYPGIVTISSVDPLVHEIAHQWFYGIISNDPFDESWFDEGFTTFATSYYFYDFWKYSEEESFDFPNRHLNSISKQGVIEPANSSVFDNEEQRLIGLYYGLAPIKIWELLKLNGMQDDATTFLKAYFDTYAYKQVNTIEFVRFAQSYFQMEGTVFFEEWLDF